jgi:hypothetical protein
MRTALLLACTLSLSLDAGAQSPPPAPAVAAPAAAAPRAEPPKKGQMYRWKDASGNWQFTDTPPPQGAENYTPQAVLQQAKPQQDSSAILNRPVSKPAAPASYTVSFSSPTADQVITPDITSVTVALSVEPTLEPGHQVQVMVDGKPAFKGLAGALSGLERGSHSLSAKVLDAKGNELSTAAGPTFHIRKHHQ